MINFREILSLFVIINSAFASYSGPYLLWGIDRLAHVQLPALEAVDERTLTSMYTEAKAVVIFLRNSTNKLDQNHFPKFKELIATNKWTYLPQNTLPAEPVDYNSNVDVISLVGPPSQQDIELTALYKDAVTIYGEGEVLGILANQAEDVHFIYKRELTEDNKDSTTSSAPPTSTAVSPSDEPIVDDCVYLTNHGLLYTSSPPEINWKSSSPEEKDIVVAELKEHGYVTEDDRTKSANVYRLSINFKTYSIVLHFRFTISDNYWYLTQVEAGSYYENTEKRLPMDVVGEPPSALIGYSYSCSRELIFRNGSNYLKLKDIQVQPLLADDQKSFDDAFNCIGFMTVPIWSGVFVSSIILFGTFIGIIALMDIKTPNRFESNRNKQLTFTVQE